MITSRCPCCNTAEHNVKVGSVVTCKRCKNVYIA